MDDELCHHGVKGQKWGVRRTKAQLGYKTTSSTKKKTASKSTSTRAASKRKRPTRGLKIILQNIVRLRSRKRRQKPNKKRISLKRSLSLR